jgi:hypothetical protein
MVQGALVRMTPGTSNKKGPLRTRVSNFMITFNTNQRYQGEDEDFGEYSTPLYDMAEAMFGNEETLKQFVVFPRGGEWNDDNIISFRVTTRAELGHNLRGSRVHFHVGIKILHRSFIQLDPVKIKEMSNIALAAMNFRTPIRYVHISVLRPDIEDYLSI